MNIIILSAIRPQTTLSLVICRGKSLINPVAYRKGERESVEEGGGREGKGERGEGGRHTERECV